MSTVKQRIAKSLSRKPGLWATAAFLFLLAAFIGLLEIGRPHVDGDRLRLDQFEELVDEQRIRNAEVLDQDSYVVGDYERGDGSVGSFNVPYLSANDSRNSLIDNLVDKGVPTTVNQQFVKSLQEPMQYILPAMMIVVVIVFMVSKILGGNSLFGSTGSGSRRADDTSRAVTFANIGGAEQAIEELGEVREYLQDPGRFARMGARIPRGYLLSGPPGCGKTLLARALAGESGAAFFSISGPNFMELYVGVGAARVRELFREAHEAAPSIVFIDEIDAIGARRGSGGDSHREREQTLNQILIELDGFDQQSGVIVMAATNRPDILDPALVRPGRFDRRVSIDLPDRNARREILAVHAAGKPLSPDVDLDRVASITRGLSGADLANVLNEATLLGARRGVEQISMALVEEGVDRVSMGISRAHVLSDEERRVVAIHEAGHALVGMSLPGGHAPHRVSILSRGGALGAVRWQTGAQDEVVFSRSVLIDRMATTLGGRVAEELTFGEAGSASADDLSQVSELARRMVRDWGMSEAVGAMTYAEDGEQGYSQDTTRLIDSEARALVKEAESRARAVLTDARDSLDRVAAALIERETLDLQDIERLATPPMPQAVP